MALIISMTVVAGCNTAAAPDDSPKTGEGQKGPKSPENIKKLKELKSTDVKVGTGPAV